MDGLYFLLAIQRGVWNDNEKHVCRFWLAIVLLHSKTFMNSHAESTLKSLPTFQFFLM